MDASYPITTRSMEAMVTTNSIEWSSTGQRIIPGPPYVSVTSEPYRRTGNGNTTNTEPIFVPLPNVAYITNRLPINENRTNGIQPFDVHMNSLSTEVSSFRSPSIIHPYSLEEIVPSNNGTNAEPLHRCRTESIPLHTIASTSSVKPIIGCTMPVYDIKGYISQKLTYSSTDELIFSGNANPIERENITDVDNFLDTNRTHTSTMHSSALSRNADYQELVSPKVTLFEANILLSVLNSPHPTNQYYGVASLLSTEPTENTVDNGMRCPHGPPLFTNRPSKNPLSNATASSQSTVSVLPSFSSEFSLQRSKDNALPPDNERLLYQTEDNNNNDNHHHHPLIHYATDSTESLCSYVESIGGAVNYVTTPGTAEMFSSLLSYPENSSSLNSSSQTSIISLGTSTASLMLHNSDTNEHISKPYSIDPSWQSTASLNVYNDSNDTDTTEKSNRSMRMLKLTRPEFVLSTEENINHHQHYPSFNTHYISMYNETIRKGNSSVHSVHPSILSSTQVKNPSLLVPEISWNLLQYLDDNYRYTDKFFPRFGKPLVRIIPSTNSIHYPYTTTNYGASSRMIIILSTDTLPSDCTVDSSDSQPNRVSFHPSHGLLCILADTASRTSHHIGNYTGSNSSHGDEFRNTPSQSQTREFSPSTFEFSPIHLNNVSIPPLLPYLETNGWKIPSTNLLTKELDENSYIRDMDWLNPFHTNTSSAVSVSSQTAVLAMGRYLAKLQINTDNTTEPEEANYYSSSKEVLSDNNESSLSVSSLRVTYEPILIRHSTAAGTGPVMHLASDDMRSVSCSSNYPGYTAVGGHDKLVTLYDLNSERILSFIPTKGVVSKLQWSSINPSILVWSNDESVLEYADIRCLSSVSFGSVQKLRSSTTATFTNNNISVHPITVKAVNPSSSHSCYTPTLGMYTFSILNARLAIAGYGNGYIDIIEPPSSSSTKASLSLSSNDKHTRNNSSVVPGNGIPPAIIHQRIRDPYVRSISDILYDSQYNRIICNGTNGFSVWKINNYTNYPPLDNKSVLPYHIECTGYSTVDSYRRSFPSIPVSLPSSISITDTNHHPYVHGSFVTFPLASSSSSEYSSFMDTENPQSVNNKGLGYLSIDSCGYLNLYRL